jgi:putative FmdB family regulatory protein
LIDTMPSYDYVCTSCGHEFELVQKMTDPPRKRCPKCRKKVERKIGAGAGLLFKGSGFYITDYRSSEYRAKEKAESGAGASTGTKAATSGKGTADGADKGAASSSGGSSTEKSGGDKRKADGGTK